MGTSGEKEKFAVYAVKSLVAAAPPPFAQIRADLLSEWRFAEGQKVARDKARAIVKAVEGGKSLNEAVAAAGPNIGSVQRSEEHTSELQSLMRISYAVFCLKKKTNQEQRALTK